MLEETHSIEMASCIHRAGGSLARSDGPVLLERLRTVDAMELLARLDSEKVRQLLGKRTWAGCISKRSQDGTCCRHR